jgi:transposase
MQVVTTTGLDVAKSVFRVHGIDAEGNVLIRRKLKRHYVLAFFESGHRARNATRVRQARPGSHPSPKRLG